VEVQLEVRAHVLLQVLVSLQLVSLHLVSLQLHLLAQVTQVAQMEVEV
jgi:hypothetical protein